MKQIENNEALERELAQLIVDTLNLDLSPESIHADTVLFQESGLGLDSIDALELAFGISKKYGIKIKPDDTDNVNIFDTLGSLASYIHKEQAG